MLYLIETVLNQHYAQKVVHNAMKSNQWWDGRTTNNNKKLKRNLQLFEKDLPETFAYIKESLLENHRILNNFFPRQIHNMMITRSGYGMHYGLHNDVIITKDGRRDLSFTLFLCDKSSYQGGDLCLQIPPEEKNFRLEQGEVVVYPTKYIHEVKPVTDGERIVCVGWIESEIPEQEDREILSTLSESLNHINDKTAHTNAINGYLRLYKRLSG